MDLWSGLGKDSSNGRCKKENAVSRTDYLLLVVLGNEPCSKVHEC